MIFKDSCQPKRFYSPLKLHPSIHILLQKQLFIALKERCISTPKAQSTLQSRIILLLKPAVCIQIKKWVLSWNEHTICFADPGQAEEVCFCCCWVEGSKLLDLMQNKSAGACVHLQQIKNRPEKRHGKKLCQSRCAPAPSVTQGLQPCGLGTALFSLSLLLQMILCPRATSRPVSTFCIISQCCDSKQSSCLRREGSVSWLPRILQKMFHFFLLCLARQIHS